MLAGDAAMKSAGPAISALFLVLVTLLLLYVLLLGPAVRLHHRGILTKEIEIVYAPLEWAAHHFSFIERTLIPYISLWAPHDPSPPPPASAVPPPIAAPTTPVPAPAGS
jgi:hypothetical protein